MTFLDYYELHSKSSSSALQEQLAVLIRFPDKLPPIRRSISAIEQILSERGHLKPKKGGAF